MKERSELKALKEGDVVTHTIRSYVKPVSENVKEVLPTAYCNEILPDNTIDKRPILPINSDSVILEKNGKPYHLGKKVRMRIVDTSNDTYYLAYYYMDEIEEDKEVLYKYLANLEEHSFKMILDGTVKANEVVCVLTATYENGEPDVYRATYQKKLGKKSESVYSELLNLFLNMPIDKFIS